MAVLELHLMNLNSTRHCVIEKEWTFPARLVRVIDGDTLRMTLDFGFRIRQDHNLRLAGVDTPEMYSGSEEEKAKGRAVAQMVSTWLFDRSRHTAAHAPGLSEYPFVVTTDKDRRTFNRFIALSVRCRESGEDLVEWLKEQGY